MASKVDPFFIVSFTSTRSQRDEELEQARARSHAATVGHQRRRCTRTVMVTGKCKAKAPKTYQVQIATKGKEPKNLMPTLQRGWQSRSLTVRDPFASFAGHDVPPVCLEALDFGMRLSLNAYDCFMGHFD
jgi:hypothetical protein